MTKDEIRDSIVAIAESHIGYTESPRGSNKTMFGEWYGLDGVQWCAIFVSYCYSHGGYGIGKVDTEEGFHYCPTLYYRAKQNGWDTKEPKKGDIVLFNFKGDISPEHTGIFLKWADAEKTKFYCLEGNTSSGNKGSQANGDGVYKRLRYMAMVSSFVNIIDNRL